MTGLSSAVDILRELVAITTPSSVSNLPLLNWVAAYLEDSGWSVQFFPYEDEKGITKANLIAWPCGVDREGVIRLAFVCHTDTVPYAKDWQGALRLSERDGHLHGCGACDVKGSLACFLAAIKSVAGAVNPYCALILTADEEVGCQGMERLLAATSMRITSAIVSEPTSLRPGISGKGYGLARVVVEGGEAHSAFPQQGVSAISVAARLLAKIEDEFTPILNDHLFDPPHTTLNIGLIEGGTAKNIIPGRCSFLVEWRAVPGDSGQDVFARIIDIIGQFQVNLRPRGKAVIKVDLLRNEPGFGPADTGPLQERLAGLLDREPIGISFGSEASRIARVAHEVIVIGPGDMRTAHSDRECVPLSELDAWTETLANLITR